MTAKRSPEPQRAESAAAQSSPIRDRGYTRYDGSRLPHRNRYRVLAQRTLSLAWDSGLVKTTFILGMFPMVVCAVIMYLKIKAAQMLRAQGLPLPDQVADPEHWVYYCVYWCQLWFAFVMSLIVAAPAIAEDVRTGAFQFYFSRPVSRGHYVGGKLASVAVLIIAVCAGPGLLLALLRIALSDGAGEAVAQLPLLLATIGFALIYAATMTLPALALSALSRRSGYVMAAWTTAFFVPWILGEGTAAATDMPYAALLSIPTNLRLVAQAMFGVESSYPLPWYLPAGVLAALLVASAVVLWRRLARAEVLL